MLIYEYENVYILYTYGSRWLRKRATPCALVVMVCVWLSWHRRHHNVGEAWTWWHVLQGAVRFKTLSSRVWNANWQKLWVFSFLLDLFELDAKLLGHRKVSVLCVSQQRQAFFGHHFFGGKSFEGYLCNFLQVWSKLVNKSMSQDRLHCHRCTYCIKHECKNMCAWDARTCVHVLRTWTPPPHPMIGVHVWSIREVCTEAVLSVAL